MLIVKLSNAFLKIYIHFYPIPINTPTFATKPIFEIIVPSITISLKTPIVSQTCSYSLLHIVPPLKFHNTITSAKPKITISVSGSSLIANSLSLQLTPHSPAEEEEAQERVNDLRKQTKEGRRLLPQPSFVNH
ncbi:hypothetical protein TNCV_437541 [Trichonephila clavipes]|nr:hypothetical protein TNCV_437541 [Trichonephila clavipes]